jgi:adenylate cyclase
MRSPPGVEIERKFLPHRLPDGLPEGQRIEQGYLAVAPDGVEVRVRRRAGRSTLTVKSGPAQVRTEEELEIEDRRFESLWPLTEGRRIDKVRHVVPLGEGLEAELDVYSEPHAGLLVAEVEFPTREASDRFAPPAWLGREVTGDARYANQSLALQGAPGAQEHR